MPLSLLFIFFFSSRRRHTRYIGDWSSDVCSSDLEGDNALGPRPLPVADAWIVGHVVGHVRLLLLGDQPDLERSEERRVGKECRCRWGGGRGKKKRGTLMRVKEH